MELRRGSGWELAWEGGARPPGLLYLAGFSEQVSGYRSSLEPGSAAARVIVLTEGSATVRGPDGAARSLRALLIRAHAGPALVEQVGSWRGLEIGLSPAAAASLAGPGAGAWVPLEELDGPARGLPRALASSDRWERHFDAARSALLAHLHARLEPRLELAARLLESSRGRLSVAELAQRVGWSSRHLSAQLRQTYGLGPKQIARLLRHDHALELLRAGAPQAQAALAAGYCDQAHMSREFRAIADRTPGESTTPPSQLAAAWPA